MLNVYVVFVCRKERVCSCSFVDEEIGSVGDVGSFLMCVVAEGKGLKTQARSCL